jgi:imidazolonepropionase-like amidohydrolase
MAVALRAARLFDGERLLEGGALVIEGPAVVDVGAVPAGVPTEDLGDATLLPGLVDTHQHLVFDGNGSLEEQVRDRSDDDLRDRARENARRALQAGITTIRDLGDRGFVTLDLRDESGLPTVLAAGPPLTPTGGHCWYLGGVCADVDALLAAVEDRRARGCDTVKIMVTGGAHTPSFPMWSSQFDLDALRAAVDAAHTAGLPVAAHCHGADGTLLAVEAGVDTIEHCSFMRDGGRTEPDEGVLDRIAASGIPVSATMGRLPDHTAPPMVEQNIRAIQDALRDLRGRGATIVAGTDAGIGPGKPHDVLPHAASWLAEIGLDGRGVLATMTSTAAEVVGVGNRKGRLAAGYDADVLAVRGDPIADPSALLDVLGVWRAGVPVRREGR